MNAKLPSPPRAFRRPNAAQVGLLSFAAVLLILGLIGFALVPPSESQTNQHRPPLPGQFQADLRTIAAAFRFLLESDSSLPSVTTPTGASPAALVCQPVKSHPEARGYHSNQSEFPVEPSTNRPTRS